MNEQIESYLKQHHCRDYFNSYGETVEDDHYFMYREDVDGLIELIVKETLMQMAIQMDKFGDNQANNPTWYKSEEVVKKHFRVE